jgi:hypothetical protein
MMTQRRASCTENTMGQLIPMLIEKAIRIIRKSSLFRIKVKNIFG